MTACRPIYLRVAWYAAVGVLAAFAVPTPAAADEASEPPERRVIDQQDEVTGDEHLLDDYDSGREILERRHAERRAREAAQVEQEAAERLRSDRRLERSAGWTLMHASTQARLALWITHGNDDVARFFHDFRMLLQVPLPVPDWDLAAFAMWGFRMQATSRDTGPDALWLGAKLHLPVLDPEIGALGFGATFGLPTSKRVDGEPTVFGDHPNALIFVDAVTIDLAVFTTFYFDERAGINLNASLQFPLGMPTPVSINGGVEIYVRTGEPAEAEGEAVRVEWSGWASDFRFGVMASSAFTPLTFYGEYGRLYRDLIRLAVRAGVLIGVGPNLGNASDLQLLGIFEWRFGGHFRDE